MAKKNNVSKVQKKVQSQVTAAKKLWNKETKKALSVTKKSFSSAHKKVNSYIKKNPEKAALIAAAVGAALAAGVSGAFKKKRK